MSEEITCRDIDWLDEQHDIESMLETLDSIEKLLQSYLRMIKRCTEPADESEAPPQADTE